MTDNLSTVNVSYDTVRHHMSFLRFLSKILDTRFNILGFKFGLDPIIGLIPGVGDIISVALSVYILFIGAQMKIPSHELNRMVGNIVLDFIIGLIPALGDAADFVFRANERNFKILQKYYHGDIEGKL